MEKNLFSSLSLTKNNCWIFIPVIFFSTFFIWVSIHNNKAIPIKKIQKQSFAAKIKTLPAKSLKKITVSYPNKEKPDGLFDSIIDQAANQYQIDSALIKAIIMAESGYNPNAQSHKGARGLMQLMPATAKWLGVEDSFDPEHNINGGVKYFKQLLVKFDGDVKLALAAYNAGTQKVRKYNGIPPFKTTHYYITKVFKYYEYYKKQAI